MPISEKFNFKLSIGSISDNLKIDTFSSKLKKISIPPQVKSFFSIRARNSKNSAGPNMGILRSTKSNKGDSEIHIEKGSDEKFKVFSPNTIRIFNNIHDGITPGEGKESVEKKLKKIVGNNYNYKIHQTLEYILARMNRGEEIEVIGGHGYINKSMYEFFGNDIATGMERISIGRSNPIPSYNYKYNNDNERKRVVLEELSDMAKRSMVIPKEIFPLEKIVFYCEEERKNGRSILLNKDKKDNIILFSVDRDFGNANLMWGYEDTKHDKEIKEWNAAIGKMWNAANDFIEENKNKYAEIHAMHASWKDGS